MLFAFGRFGSDTVHEYPVGTWIGDDCDPEATDTVSASVGSPVFVQL